MKASILIPFYNDLEALPTTLERLTAAIAALPLETELLLCDDGSEDGGAEWLEAQGIPALRVIRGPHLGKGGTLRRGVLAASGELIFYTDCDLAYGTDVILPFLRAVEKNGGIAVGKREKEGYGAYSAFRVLCSKAYRGLLGRLIDLPVSDPQSGCKAYRREAALAVFRPLQECGYSFEFETLARAASLEIPITELSVSVLTGGKSHVRPLRDGFAMFRAARRISKQFQKKC